MNLVVDVKGYIPIFLNFNDIFNLLKKDMFSGIQCLGGGFSEEIEKNGVEERGMEKRINLTLR